ncbi:MAG: hypothetical protein ABIN48_12610 [Ginsengibacter sp.]
MGIQIKYMELFTFSIEQLFYANKSMKDVRLNPVSDFEMVVLPESFSVLRKMNLLTITTESKPELIVLAPVKEKIASGNYPLKYAPKNDDVLSFGIQLKNTHVLHQNDLPLLAFTNRAFYFSNLIVDPVAARSALHISKNTNGVKAEDLILTTGPVYRFQEPGPVLAEDVELKHLLTGKTVPPELITMAMGKTDLLFNLTSMRTGKFELRIQGVLKDTFYYKGLASTLPLFAVVEFFFSPDLESNYRMMESDGSITPDRPSYFISLNNRETVWRYTFQLNESSPLFQELATLNLADKTTFLDHLNIVSNDAGVTFKQKGMTEREMIFESENKLFLKEKYFTSLGNNGLKLTLEKNSGLPNQAAVKNNLPFPSTGLIDTTTPLFVYSDIFITI